jgi:hypothetical protein
MTTLTKSLDYDQLFPGRFLKAGEFLGRSVTLTISGITLEDLPQETGGTKARGIIAFVETKKSLVLNRTNGEAFKAMWGRDTGAWVGKRVTLYPAPWNGDVAIRVQGSPDLEADLDFELKLPRKRPLAMRLLKTPDKKSNPQTTEA